MSKKKSQKTAGKHTAPARTEDTPVVKIIDWRASEMLKLSLDFNNIEQRIVSAESGTGMSLADYKAELSIIEDHPTIFSDIKEFLPSSVEGFKNLPESATRAILDNCNTKIFMRSPDEETAQFVSGNFGGEEVVKAAVEGMAKSTTHGLPKIIRLGSDEYNLNDLPIRRKGISRFIEEMVERDLAAGRKVVILDPKHDVTQDFSDHPGFSLIPELISDDNDSSFIMCKDPVDTQDGMTALSSEDIDPQFKIVPASDPEAIEYQKKHGHIINWGSTRNGMTPPEKTEERFVAIPKTLEPLLAQYRDEHWDVIKGATVCCDDQKGQVGQTQFASRPVLNTKFEPVHHRQLTEGKFKGYWSPTFMGGRPFMTTVFEEFAREPELEERNRIIASGGRVVIPAPGSEEGYQEVGIAVGQKHHHATWGTPVIGMTPPEKTEERFVAIPNVLNQPVIEEVVETPASNCIYIDEVTDPLKGFDIDRLTYGNSPPTLYVQSYQDVQAVIGTRYSEDYAKKREAFVAGRRCFDSGGNPVEWKIANTRKNYENHPELLASFEAGLKSVDGDEHITQISPPLSDAFEKAIQVNPETANPHYFKDTAKLIVNAVSQGHLQEKSVVDQCEDSIQDIPADCISDSTVSTIQERLGSSFPDIRHLEDSVEYRLPEIYKTKVGDILIQSHTNFKFNLDSSSLPSDFIATLPPPNSSAAVAEIKAAVKKYRAELSESAQGSKHPSLMQTYTLVAQALGFKTWEALVAVADRAVEKPVVTVGESEPMRFTAGRSMTCNRLRTFLSICRGTLQNEMRIGTFDDDIKRLIKSEYLDQEWRPTGYGTAYAKCLVENIGVGTMQPGIDIDKLMILLSVYRGTEAFEYQHNSETFSHDKAWASLVWAGLIEKGPYSPGAKRGIKEISGRQSWQLTDKGNRLVEMALSFRLELSQCPSDGSSDQGCLSVGDVVVPIRSENALRSGGCAYDSAIVISADPFILASAEGDMRWSATARPENFRSIGKADPAVLKTAMRRIDR